MTDFFTAHGVHVDEAPRAEKNHTLVYITAKNLSIIMNGCAIKTLLLSLNT